VTTLTRPRAATGNGGIAARRAVMRWGWRLFRREWRQQLLILGLLTVAVAATIWGAGVANNTLPHNPDYATFGTAAAFVTLPGGDPHLAADIAAIQSSWGPADLIETQNVITGTTQQVQLRAESPHGMYNGPMLSLVSGAYPSGPAPEPGDHAARLPGGSAGDQRDPLVEPARPERPPGDGDRLHPHQ
jgi:putative ABC transport system permease protein